VVTVGSGNSLLVDDLLDHGYSDIVAVDISRYALDRLVERLGERAGAVTTVVADVRQLALPEPVDVWHDRAVFHFFTEPADRAAYVARAAAAVRPGGHLVLATFALDGPEHCTGLRVERYDAERLAAAIGTQFELIDALTDKHVTPWGAEQPFQHAVFVRT
jgi:SAM-dependent methyltransferase